MDNKLNYLLNNGKASNNFKKKCMVYKPEGNRKIYVNIR